MFLRLLLNLMLFGFALVIAQNSATLAGREWQLEFYGPVAISSAKELEFEALNTVLMQNPSASWAQNPLLIALTLLRSPDAAEVTVSRLDDAVEGATGSVVTIIEESLLDDSVVGRLLRVSFIQENGAWRVDSVQEAFRCARGDNTAVYTAGPCP